MNVLVVNSSPRSAYISTGRNMLNPLVKAMKDAGAHVDTVNLHEKKINICRDCTCCMTTSIGKCVMQDDMTKEIMPLYMEADIMVLSTPIYFGTLNSMMKIFIERLFPLLDNHQSLDEEGFHHSFRKIWPKIVAVATASWDYPTAFEQLSSYFKYLFRDQLMAEIYRGNHNAFAHCDAYKEKKEEIMQALSCAGKQIVEHSMISSDVLEIICAPLSSKDKIVISHNLSIDSCIELGINITEWTETGKLIMPGTLDNFIDLMRLMYHPEEVKKEFSIKFCFSGKIDCECCFKVGKTLQIVKGAFEPDSPDITIKAPFQIWMKVMNGSGSCLQMMMRKKIEIEGNAELLTDFQQVFYLVKYY